jgi:hypothetical protein
MTLSLALYGLAAFIVIVWIVMVIREMRSAR